MFDVFRELYNAALQERRDAYQKHGVSVNYYAQANQLKDIRKEREDLANFSATAAQQVLRRLDKTFAAFFRRIKAGETPGYPRFKSYSRFKSVPFVFGDGAGIRDNRLHIKGVGQIKIKWHRPIPCDAKIKQVIVKRSGDKWYAFFQIELPEPQSVSHSGPAVGIDLGVSSLIATSDGDTITAPRHYRKAEKKLRKRQRRMARRKRGSKGWHNARKQVAKTHERVANQRRDFAHKLSHKLTESYSLIAVEDLNIAGMSKNHNLAKSILDAGWAQLLNMLSYKVENTGGQVVAVDPRNTSQVCSGCGCIVKKDLSVRVHHCLHCGLILDRDVNAAINILNRAFKLARTEPSGANVAVRNASVA
jgi:putative transposase